MGSHEQEHLVFQLWQVDGLAVLFYFIISAADLQRAPHQPRLILRVALALIHPVPPQQALDPRRELGMGERFWQVVVGTYSQPKRNILFLPLCGEKEYGDIALLPDRLAHPDAGHAGHHDIQNHQIQLRMQQLKGLLSAGSQSDIVAFAGEQDLQQLPDVGIVVHYKDLTLCHDSISLLLSETHFILWSIFLPCCGFGKKNATNLRIVKK